MIVGLTGGIACGKSTVATILKTLGATVIDADVVAREVVAPGTEGLRAIQNEFGNRVLTAQGDLDRDEMRTIILDDPAAKASLEAITHPRIRSSIADSIRNALASGASIVFVEAALLVETGSHALYPHLWVVCCDESTQVQRLVSRNGCSMEEALKWVNAQMSPSEKASHASPVSHNNGTVDDLRREVEAAFSRLTELLPDRD